MRTAICLAALVAVLAPELAHAAAAVAPAVAPAPSFLPSLPTVAAPKAVQDAAPYVTQACSVWSTLWPQVKDNLMGPLALSGIASLAAMILPQAAPGTPYSLLRQVVDLIALNMRNAANAPKVGS